MVKLICHEVAYEMSRGPSYEGCFPQSQDHFKQFYGFFFTTCRKWFPKAIISEKHFDLIQLLDVTLLVKCCQLALPDDNPVNKAAPQPIQNSTHCILKVRNQKIWQ